MFKNFKYMELTRHHIIKKAKKLVDDNNKKDEGNFDQISEVVFSSTLSLYISYLTETFFVSQSISILEFFGIKNVSKIVEAVILFLTGILIFVGLFLLIKKIYRRLLIRWRNHKYQRECHAPDLSLSKIKELIDDFDNITFDNLLIAYDYIEQLEKNSQGSNKEILTFYFHEIIYYLRMSIKNAKEITSENKREKCLNIFGNTNGIDVFRLFNANEMMLEIVEKLENILKDSSKPINTYDPALKQVVDHQLKEIKHDAKEVQSRCADALNDLKPKT